MLAAVFLEPSCVVEDSEGHVAIVIFDRGPTGGRIAVLCLWLLVTKIPLFWGEKLQASAIYQGTLTTADIHRTTYLCAALRLEFWATFWAVAGIFVVVHQAR